MSALRRFAAVAGPAFALMAVAGPAAAVQTDRFGLAATGDRSSILVAPGHGAVQEQLVVYNRTAGKMTVLLDVVDAIPQPDHTLNFGGPGRGLAKHIDISVRQADLAPHEQRNVVVTVHRPVSIKKNEYAAVTAVERASASSGVGVTQRLAVFVGIVSKGGDAAGAASAGHRTKDGSRLAVVVVAAVLAAFTALLLAMARRRRS